MTYEFAIFIDADPETFAQPATLDRLCEAGCKDATFAVIFGVATGRFAREAYSLNAAVESAIVDITKAGVGTPFEVVIDVKDGRNTFPIRPDGSVDWEVTE